MGISYNCSCGKYISVPNDAGGKNVTCPACRQTSRAPFGELVEPPQAVGLTYTGGRQIECWNCLKSYSASNPECPNCGKRQDQDLRRRNRPKEGSLVLDVFAAYFWGLKGLFPLAGAVLKGGIFCALMLTLAIVGGWTGLLISSIMVTIWSTGYQNALSFQVVQSGALRSEEFPELPPMFSLDTTVYPFFQVLSWTVVALLPAILMAAAAVAFKSPVLLLFTIPLVVLFWPFYVLGYLGLAREDSIFSLSPTRIFKTLFHRPESVTFVCVILLVTFTASVVGSFALELFSHFTTNPFTWLGIKIAGFFFSLYFIAVFGRQLGLLWYHCGDKLELHRDEWVSQRAL